MSCDLRLIKAEKKWVPAEGPASSELGKLRERTDFFQLNRKSLLDGEVSLEN